MDQRNDFKIAFSNVRFLVSSSFKTADDFDELLSVITKTQDEASAVIIEIPSDTSTILRILKSSDTDVLLEFDEKMKNLRCEINPLHEHIIAIIHETEHQKESKCVCVAFHTQELAQRFRNCVNAKLANSLVTMLSYPQQSSLNLTFVVDLQEKDASTGEFQSVNRNSDGLLKIRCQTDKRFIIGVVGDPENPEMCQVSKCVGAHICYGRFRPASEMTALAMPSLELQRERMHQSFLGENSFATQAIWSANESGLHLLNEVTERGSCVFVTLLVHLCLNNVEEIVMLETYLRMRVFRQDENFWFTRERRPLQLGVRLDLQEETLGAKNDQCVRFGHYNLRQVGFREGLASNFGLFGVVPVADVISSNGDTEEDLGEEETIVASGQGTVERGIEDEELLFEWNRLMKDWDAKAEELARQSHAEAAKASGRPGLISLVSAASVEGPCLRPLGFSLARRIASMVRRGIPEIFRIRMWPLLTGSQNEFAHRAEAYRILLAKPYANDELIKKDLTRTFPAHDKFADKKGQDELFRVNHAYALLDEELGYCQAVSFIAATLLLQLPEEQAFSLLVDIMQNYGYRRLCMNHMRGLHIMHYQLRCLIRQQLPTLARHFEAMSLHTHMYCNQWILTLFTAKFPLPMVFRVMDLFLLEGMTLLLRLTLAILREAKNRLLGLDFDACMQYFLSDIYKRFSDAEVAEQLLRDAARVKVTESQLKKFEEQYLAEEEGLSASSPANNPSFHPQYDQLQESFKCKCREVEAERAQLLEAQNLNGRLNEELKRTNELLRCAANRCVIAEQYRTIVSDLVERLAVDRTLLSASSHSALLLPFPVLKYLKEAGAEDLLDRFYPDWRIVSQAEEPSHPLDDSCGVDDLAKRVRELELELAENKCKLVQAQSDADELNMAAQFLKRQHKEQQEQQLNKQMPVTATKTWISKTLNSLKNGPSQ